MRSPVTRLDLGATALLAVLAGSALAAELTMEKVPKPVAAAAEARFPGLSVKGAASEKNEEGQLIYEISLNDKGKNIDATFTPEGTLVLIEKEITRKELPEPVTKSLTAEFPKARYKMVEQVIKVEGKEEKLDYYEVLLVNPQKQMRGVQIATDGKILEVEKKGAEGEGEED